MNVAMMQKVRHAIPTGSEWIIVDGDQVVFRSHRCGSALDYLKANKLPASSLFRSSDVAATV
jgi:hypothetical protein